MRHGTLHITVQVLRQRCRCALLWPGFGIQRVLVFCHANRAPVCAGSELVQSKHRSTDQGRMGGVATMLACDCN